MLIAILGTSGFVLVMGIMLYVTLRNTSTFRATAVLWAHRDDKVSFNPTQATLTKVSPNGSCVTIEAR
ncbi:MAG: hypothetical protein A2826_03170 [Candidatus Doudnabacteria bacterium RIFCSPHIGHO2_01_FULL_43_23]|uniref:Uncharacterized protein n=1 Tax=Candidatus Doudnabacteria bacterium RIFCSPHIGHO2_01_FULL_43_23 TaxID=1817822 RepID=A0A1F5NRE3_9BACT|nr:MAG: hypothetical protein A2826_03170 [Candidatus Doudnabacteria bacterium RIFCSPHIGHO2_01_FULL_43_23]